MPAYSFKEQFCPFVEEGSKLQTVRALRNGRQGHAKPGDPIYLYYGMRTKWCRKLALGRCTKNQAIAIYEDGRITLDGTFLTEDERERFAWNDGFRPAGTSPSYPSGAVENMLAFWRKTHSLPFMGVVICWELMAKPVNSEWKIDFKKWKEIGDKIVHM